jgi:excisionase family DNA binding protein
MIQLINLSINDLKCIISDVLKQEHSNVPPPQSDRLVSPKETCEKLGIDLSTLYRWDKLGYLSKIKIGGKVRYRWSDIEKLIKPGNS